MPGSDRELKILLKVESESADLDKLNGQLKEVQVQAAETNAAVSGASSGSDSSTVALSDAAQGRLTIEERIASIITQRQILVDIELEKTQALVAGDTERAAILGKDLDLRQLSLQLQTQARFTEEEALVIARERIAAETAIALAQQEQGATGILASVNLNKAKGEAIVLARELATGSLNARTMGAFLGSLGTTLTIAGIAGYALFQAVSHAADDIVKMNQEMLKQVQETQRAVDEWLKLAGLGDKFADEVRLSEKIATDLQKAAGEYAQWRATELTLWQKFADTVAGMLAAINFGATSSPNAEALLASQRLARTNVVAQIVGQQIAIENLKKSEADWAREQADLAAGIPEVQAKVTSLTSAINAQEAIISKIAGKGAGMSDAERSAAQAAIEKRAELNQQLQVAQGHLDTLNKDQDKLNKTTGGEVDARREISAEFRETALHLEAIKGLMSVIENDPFATVFQKANAQAALIPQVIKTIQADIEKLNAKVKGGLLDPTQLETARQKLLQDNLALIKLGQTAKTLSFGGTLKADLISWANQFGTTAHQIAGEITNSIGTAINGVSSGITGLIFHTGSLGQAFLQVAESIVQSLIQVGLQILAQKIIGTFVTSENTAEQIAAGKAIAAGTATAAAYMSVISYGAADVAAGIALGAVVAAAQASASFAGGGYTGDGPRLAPAGVVHRGEYVQDAQTVTRAGGPGFFDNLRVAINRPGYERGGSVGGSSSSSARSSGGSPNHFYFFTDKDAMHRHFKSNPANKKLIIDWLNQAGGHFRV